MFLRHHVLATVAFVTGWLTGCGELPSEGKSATAASSSSSATETAHPQASPSVPVVNRSDFVALAQNLADPMMLKLDEEQWHKEMAQLVAEAQVKVVRFQSIRSSDPLVVRIAKEAAESGTAMIEGQQNLDAMSKDDGFSSFVVAALGLYLGEPTAFISGAGGLLAKGDAIQQERIKWAAAFNRSRAAQLMLPEAAKGHAAPKSESEKVIGIDFDEGWGGTTDHDTIKLSNGSGQALTNCAILVELRGSNGDVRQNVHFVPSWENAGVRYAKYGMGIESDSGIYGRRTVYGLEEIRLSIWAEELSKEDISYSYAGAEQDRDIRMILERDLQLLWNYSEYQDWISSPKQISIALTLEKIKHLPPHRVTLTFNRAILNSPAEKVQLHWDMKEWSAGEERTFDATGKVQDMRPGDAIDVEISFPDISYVWKRTRVLQEGVKTPIRLGGSN